MRSLTLTRASIEATDSFVPDGIVGAVTVNPENGVIYAAIERNGEEGGVQIELLSLQPGQGGKHDIDVVASFSSPVLAPFKLPSYRSQVVDLRYFADDQSLVILLAGGDIGTLSVSGIDAGTPAVDVVGSVDSGIKAAAWSPDEEQLIIVTGEDMLVCMTRYFDLLHEEPLRKEDFGEDEFINVGWGSKSTQFHGSLGKTAAQEPVASTSALPDSLSHPTDDGLPVITFRGDCAYFAISSLDSYGSSTLSRRQVRIYSRDSGAGFIPKLSTTSENLPGLEAPLAWRPSGNVISSLVRYGYEGGGPGREGKWDVAMLERNGLRHGGFGLREGMDTWAEGRVRGMSWNADSELLAIWVERKEGDVVQLWSMKNYHYYLKQEISAGDRKRFRGMKWHPELPLSLFLFTDDTVQTRQYEWETHTARLAMPRDTATVAVIDGDKLLVTPFRTQNTPPPMASYTLSLAAPISHVSLSHTSDTAAVLLTDGTICMYDLGTKVPEKGQKRVGGKAAQPVQRWQARVELNLQQQVCIGEDQVAVLGVAGGEGVVVVLEDGKEVERSSVEGGERLLWDQAYGFVVLDGEGSLKSVTTQEELSFLTPHPTAIAIDPSQSIIFALAPNGKLIASLSSSQHSLASSVTSFVLTPDFIIYTTTSSHAHFASLSTLAAILQDEDVPPYQREWETRRVERGALLVTATPSEMSLVMQMPRGNLETVYPRPMVLAVVRRHVLDAEYRSALLICRKHRLDLNILYDLDPAQFMDKMDDFVRQIPEGDYLNLFVSALSDEDCSKVLYRDLARDDRKVNPNKVNSICDALRSLLEKDVVKNIESILTTHVCKRPADYESGLRVLLQLQADHADIVEDAVKYIIFLSDVNQLYDVALGMYDFQLVLMVAQYSQKDPKEYLPFLRELRALGKHEQRFRIDDHLGRRDKALKSLKEAGDEKWEDASSYMARYELFDVGFDIWKGDQDKLKVVNTLYGDYLYDRRDFIDAATSYALAKNWTRALKAYEKAHAWRELFALAKEQSLSDEEVGQLVERVADHLASRGRTIEASRVILEYTKDVSGAVDVLCRGADFAEAYRVATLHDQSELIESVIHPGLEDAHESLAEVFEEMEGQLDKEINRIRELMKLRRSDPDAFYLIDHEPDLEGVDVATNATTAVTNFTRYTVAPTVFSQSTRITGQTAKTRNRPSKRRQAGRKGTVDEWDYLIQSLNRLVLRVDEKSADAIPLIRHLVTASPEHQEMAVELQNVVIALRGRLDDGLKEVWGDREAVLVEVEESGGMGLGGAGKDEMDKARGVERAVVGVWKGLGPFAR